MKMAETQTLYRFQGIFEHLIRFGREPGNQVGSNRRTRPSLADALDNGNAVFARVAPLHTF